MSSFTPRIDAHMAFDEMGVMVDSKKEDLHVRVIVYPVDKGVRVIVQTRTPEPGESMEMVHLDFRKSPDGQIA